MSEPIPTIRDVARAAGVSVTTVSHVLNAVETARVKPETRLRVEEAARALGYTPNKLASGLRRQRSQTLGLLTDQIATSPFAGQIILGAQETAARLGWVVMLYSTGEDPHLEQREIRALQQHRVDGVLYATWYHHEVQLHPELARFPLVLVDCFSEGSETPSVVPDELRAGYEATRELLDHGHRRIGFITNIDPVPATAGRMTGYRQALADAALPFDPALVSSDVSETSGGYRTALRLLSRDERPTAIFSYNDRMAMGAYRAARELGLAIPADLSIISIDNQEIIAEGLFPGLTTMALPHYAMGEWGVRKLIGQILGEEPRETEQLPALLHCPIVRRESVAAPPSPRRDDG
jgi:LacI family transcriptional regulator